MVEFGGDTGERNAIVAERAESIAGVGESVERNRFVTAQRKPVGHPSIACAQIEDLERTPEFALDAPKDRPHEMLITARADFPLAKVVREGVVICGIIGATAFRI